MKITRLPSGEAVGVEGVGSVSIAADATGLHLLLVDEEGREIRGRYDREFGLSLSWREPEKPVSPKPENVLTFKREKRGGRDA